MLGGGSFIVYIAEAMSWCRDVGFYRDACWEYHAAEIHAVVVHAVVIDAVVIHAVVIDAVIIHAVVIHAVFIHAVVIDAVVSVPFFNLSRSMLRQIPIIIPDLLPRWYATLNLVASANQVRRLSNILARSSILESHRRTPVG